MWEVNRFAANCRLVESDGGAGHGGRVSCVVGCYPAAALASNVELLETPHNAFTVRKNHFRKCIAARVGRRCQY